MEGCFCFCFLGIVNLFEGSRVMVKVVLYVFGFKDTESSAHFIILLMDLSVMTFPVSSDQIPE